MENKKDIYGDVVHVVYDELSRNYGYYGNKNKLDKRLQIVSIDDAERLFDENGITLMNCRPYERQILFRHPFAPNTYIDAAKCSQVELFQDKVNKMALVLQMLGVKSVSGNAEWHERFKREIDADGHIGIKKFGTSVEYQNAQSAQEFSKINIKKEYPNAQLTPDFYARATVRAKELGLYNDSTVRSFIESRNPEYGGNVLGSEHITMELSKEYNELTSIAFSLNFLKVFEIGFNYKETIETFNKVTIDLEVKF